MSNSIESKLNKGKLIILISNIVAIVFFLLGYYFQRNSILLIPIGLLIIASFFEIIVFNKLKAKFHINDSDEDVQNPT